MKTLARRFAVIAVLGSLMCGALIAGCGGDAEDDGTVTNGANATS